MPIVPISKEILAVTMGKELKRTKKTVKFLLKRMQNITVNFSCTDAWKAFKVFHLIRTLLENDLPKLLKG
ncbi:MAG: hypothetical protein U0X71_03260 [Sphingobacteriaceae bacterium]